jgi:hypothetical protein
MCTALIMHSVHGRGEELGAEGEEGDGFVSVLDG